MRIFNYSDISELNSLNNEELSIFINDIRNLIIDKISKNGGFLAENLANTEVITSLFLNISENNLFFYNNNHAFLTQLLLENKFDLFKINKIENYDIELNNTKILKGSVYENLLYIKNFIIKNNKHIYFYLYNHKYSKEEIELINLFSNNNYPVTIINLQTKDLETNILTSNINKLRTSNFYYNIKNIIKNNLDKNDISKNFSDGIKNLKDNIRNSIILKKEFDNIGINYLFVKNGHDISELNNVFKKIKSFSFQFVDILVNKSQGFKYRFLDLRNKYNFTESFNIKNGELILDLKKIKLKNINQLYSLAKTYNIPIIVDKDYKDSELFYNIGEILSKEELFSLLTLENDRKKIIILNEKNINYIFDRIDIEDINISNIILIIDYNNCGSLYNTYNRTDYFNRINIYENVDILSIITFYNLCINIEKSIYLKNLVVFKTEDVFTCDKYYEISEDFKWSYLIKDSDYNKNIITYGKSLIRIEKIIKDNNLKINLINATNLSKIDSEIIKEISKNKANNYIFTKDYKNSCLYPNILKFINENQLNFNLKYYGENNFLLKNINHNKNLIENFLEEVGKDD